MKISKNLIELLKTMSKSNRIASKILESNIDNLEFQFNYLNTTDKNNTISFISSYKEKELLSKEIEVYRYSGHLINIPSSTLAKCFKIFNIDSTIVNKLLPFYSQRCELIKEVNLDGIDCCLIKFKQIFNIFDIFSSNDIIRSGDNYHHMLINKSSLFKVEPKINFYKKNRNEIKIGKLIKSLLKTISFEVNDKEIEDFVNQYKSTYDIENDELIKFDLVDSDSIQKWYNVNNYESTLGQLGNSCMRNVSDSYFDIYKENDVKLMVQYSRGGKLVNGEYKSSKIKGRALVWNNVILGDKVITFMDRIYTINDSDINLFIEKAKSNGWYWKDKDGYICNGIKKIRISPINNLIFKLKKALFYKYPYVDTLFYMCYDKKVLSSYQLPESNMSLRKTDGSFLIIN